MCVGGLVGWVSGCVVSVCMGVCVFQCGWVYVCKTCEWVGGWYLGGLYVGVCGWVGGWYMDVFGRVVCGCVGGCVCVYVGVCMF